MRFLYRNYCGIREGDMWSGRGRGMSNMDRDIIIIVTFIAIVIV
jgi:hypothetical protein